MPESQRLSAHQAAQAAKHARGVRTEPAEHFRYWFSLICLEAGESKLAKYPKRRETNLMTIQRILVVLLAITALSIHYCGERRRAISRNLSANGAAAARCICGSERAGASARQMSGRDYQFTASFEAEIQKAVDFYVRRIGNQKPGKTDARVIFERGQTVAPTLTEIFRAREVSAADGNLCSADRIGIHQPAIAQPGRRDRHVSVPAQDRRTFRLEARLIYWMYKSRPMPQPVTSQAA